MVVNLAVAEEAKQAFDLFVANRAREPDAVHIDHGNEDRVVVGDNAQIVKTAGRAENRLFFDTFDDTQTMIRVDDLVADLKCHGSPSGRAIWKAEVVPAALQV